MTRARGEGLTEAHWGTLAWLASARFRTIAKWTRRHVERIQALCDAGYAQTKCGGGYITSRYYITEAGRAALAAHDSHPPRGAGGEGDDHGHDNR